MSERKKAQRTMRIMLLLLFFLIACTAAFGISIYTFNNTERHYDSGQACDAFSLTVAPRTGQTDSWIKRVEENGRTIASYNGIIFDVTINNTGDYNISKWNLRIDINQEEIFLNNAWCGKFEIHQFVDGIERVETVDLRNYSKVDLGELNYFVADPDLMIPLHAGDYLIYLPDFITDEYPVPCKITSTYTQVVFGMIFYTSGDEPLAFEQLHMNYYLQKGYTQNPFFWMLCVGYLIWFVALVVFISLNINTKKAQVRFKQDEYIIRQSIGVFVRFFEAKDTYTNGHSQRVAQYSRLIAEKANLPEEKLRQVYYIALMHDCGKCYIPDEILKKPGKLTNEEYEIMKSHTVKGAEMLENFESIEHIKEGVLYHHERYDGKGYPCGLAGEKIPLISRIICIADSFDAMNSRRCYRDMLTKEYIISEIENNKGKQFDPELADLFLELIRDEKIEFSKEI